MEIDRVNDERVALKAPAGIAQPRLDVRWEMGTSVQRNDPLFANVLKVQRHVPWRLKDLILAIQGTGRPWNSDFACDAPCEDGQGPHVNAFRLFRCVSGGQSLLRFWCQGRNS